MSAADPTSGHLASKYGWKDDTSFRNKPHPALVHLAEAGYDPVVLPNETGRTLSSYKDSYQMSLPFGNPNTPNQTAEDAARVAHAKDHNAASTARREAFDAGRTWTMRKPTS